MADFTIGHLGSNGITGGQIPVATGAALAIKMRGRDQVVLCFFGDGAANEGVFHESLNMAAVWELPIVYVCENNLYAMSTSVNAAFRTKDIATRATAYGMPGCVVDGMDVIEIERKVREAVDRARQGKGPTLVECKTYRFLGHSRSDARIYRTRQEEDSWKERDPIKLLTERLQKEGVTQDQLKRIENRAMKEVDEAVEFAGGCAETVLAK
jgi:TPP-dependent pyruvate/acetoin dehydrogenase alpha subunit